MADVTVSYILPIRVTHSSDEELTRYLIWLAARVELIVVDGSDAPIFAAHATQWASVPLQHLHVDPDLHNLVNGKVAGVLTGLRRATQSLTIIADDDVRYDTSGLHAMVAALQDADVVRPQNYFDPLPWHAVVDTGRSLLNRISGGDWPGTIGVRTALLIATRGYDGSVMFENLELVRTVLAAGGREACRLDLYVRRLPPSTAHFWSQRVRQAYDEFARPIRLAAWLAVLPTSVCLAVIDPLTLVAVAFASVAAAEIGRRRSRGTGVFPAVASWAAPLWVCERAICAWLAVLARAMWGGIPYHGQIIERAANSGRVIRQRLKGVTACTDGV